MENTEKKILVQYTVTRYEDGAIDVSNVEGSPAENKLDQEELFNDVCDVAKVIDRKRAENAAYVGARLAIIDFYAQLQQQQAQQPEAPTEGLSL